MKIDTIIAILITAIVITTILLCISLGINQAMRETIMENPKPIDVYRNRTELQIKYVVVNNDTISCDSTVIWKN